LILKNGRIGPPDCKSHLAERHTLDAGCLTPNQRNLHGFTLLHGSGHKGCHDACSKPLLSTITFIALKPLSCKQEK